MIIGYGSYAFTPGIASFPGSSSGTSAFLTDSTALNDGMSGVACSMSFDSGSAALTQYTEITATITSALDASPPWGVVGLVDVQGLPAGTKCTFGGVTQRLVADQFGRLNAWWLPSGVNGNGPNGIFIFNDVNGSHSITPGATFSVGEIFIGRVISVRSMLQPTAGLIDPSTDAPSIGGQNRPLFRLPRRSVTHRLGTFSTADAKGGAASTLVSGANPAGVIDVETLRAYLSQSRVIAICDIPSAGRGAGTTVNGLPGIDTDYIQRNFMLCRPTDLGQLVMDQPPRWSLSATFGQSL